MTIYEIRRVLNSSGSHFFDKETLNFFWETMKSFGVHSIEWTTYVYRILSKVEKHTSEWSWMTYSPSKAVWKLVQTENGSDLRLIDDKDPIYGRFYL